MEKEISKTYRIGNFLFQIKSKQEIPIPEMFQKFSCEGDMEPEYTYEIEVTVQLPEAEGEVLARREDIVVRKTEVGESRMLNFKGGSQPYAYYEEKESNLAKTWFRTASMEDFDVDPVFLALLSMERHMMRRNQFVLHCAYMRYQGEAILFSAPSGTGKTTQAGLWQKYRGSEVVNGDRALLSIKEGKLIASGWPVSGTSGVCEPEDTPVKAIVMLGQAEENTIRTCAPREAFVQIYSQLTINTWNQEFTERAMDFIEKIIATVPVYHLDCTISEEAVCCLEDALRRQ